MILLVSLIAWLVAGYELALGVFFTLIILSIPFKIGYAVVRRCSR